MKKFKQVLRFSPLLSLTFAIWMLIEICAVLLLPALVPDTVFLGWYMGEKGESNLRRFYTGEMPAMEFDVSSGWRNAPLFEHRDWKMDRFGARTTTEISRVPDSKERVMFLGSSLVNGGEDVSVNQTISAAVEDSVTEAINFGTMMYSLDQCLLAYSNRLKDFQPDVVVVGLSGNPAEGLTNRFIPLRIRSETGMPFFKPRFIASGGQFELLDVPGQEECLSILENSVLLEDLKDTDGYYSDFIAYQRFEFTPLAKSLFVLGSKVEKLRGLVAAETSNQDLLVWLMARLQQEVLSEGGEVVFLFLPDLESISPGWRNRFPDGYGDQLAFLSGQGFSVLDGRAILRGSGEPLPDLYQRDRRHYSPLGNAVLGKALKEYLVN